MIDGTWSVSFFFRLRGLGIAFIIHPHLNFLHDYFFRPFFFFAAYYRIRMIFNISIWSLHRTLTNTPSKPGVMAMDTTHSSYLQKLSLIIRYSLLLYPGHIFLWMCSSYPSVKDAVSVFQVSMTRQFYLSLQWKHRLKSNWNKGEKMINFKRVNVFQLIVYMRVPIYMRMCGTVIGKEAVCLYIKWPWERHTSIFFHTKQWADLVL